MVLQVEAAGFACRLCTSSTDDHFTAAYLRDLRGWEQESLAKWRAICTGADIVVDCGAYLGIYGVVASKAGARRVICYEPNPSVEDKLRRTIQSNGVDSRLEVRPYALSDQNGTTHLLVPTGRNLSSGAQIVDAVNDRDLLSWQKHALVQTVRLDDDLPIASARRLDAMKVDAEGAELSVLRGASQLIREFKPSILVELLSPESLVAANSFLGDIGYPQPTALDGEHPTSRGRRHSVPGEARNFLFTPE